MAENEIAMGQNRHCLETMFQCLEDYVTGCKICAVLLISLRRCETMFSPQLCIIVFIFTILKYLNVDRG